MHPSVLIADDHLMYAEALRSALSAVYDVVGVAGDGQELTELAMQHEPNLIVTDLSMPRLSGIDAILMIKKMGLTSRIVVLTMHSEVSLAVLAFRAGASGYILKDAPGDELKRTLEVVHHGGCYLSSQFSCDLSTIQTEAARNS